MSKSTEARLETLEQLVTEQNSKLHKGLSTTIVVYIILVLIVLGYTTFMVTKLRTMTAREEVAMMIGAQLGEQLPVHRQQLIDQLNANSQNMAIEVVDQMVSSVPALENYLHQMFETQTDQVIADLQAHIIPSFSEYLKEEAPDLEARYAEMSDEEVMQGVVGLFIDTIEQEMDMYLNDTFVSDMEELQKKIHRLGNPNAELTKMEDAQRRFIMYWAHLVEVSEVGDSPLESIFKELNNRYRFFTGEDIEQLTTPILDDGE